MLTNIQALRAFAAINVVFVHSIGSAIDYGYKSPLGELFEEWGANGVDIFFVISGLIMVVTQSRNQRSSIDFAAQRIKRIVPAYWFYSFLLMAIFYLAPTVFNQLQINLGHAVASLLFFSLPFYGKPIVGVGWTLEYEMLFYLLFSLGLLAKNRTTTYRFIFLSLLALVSFGVTDPIALEFLLGMIIGIIFVEAKNNHDMFVKYAPISLILGLLALVATLFVETEIHRFFMWGIPSFFIVLGAAFTRQTSQRLLIFLGAASYSIYLSHWFVTPAFYKITKKLLPTLNQTFSIFGCVIASIIFGCFMYLIVEQPLAKLLDRLNYFRKHKSVN